MGKLIVDYVHLYVLAALIPLGEFCDPEVRHGYGVEVEPDVLELLDLTCKQQEVRILGFNYHIIISLIELE